MWETITEYLPENEVVISRVISGLLLAALIAVFAAIRKMGKAFFVKLYQKNACLILCRLVNIKKRVAFIELPNAYTWEIVKRGEKNKLLVKGTWTVKNLTDTNINLITAKLTKFKETNIVTTGMMYSPPPDFIDRGNNDLLPDKPAESVVSFELPSSAIKNKKDIISDVVITDCQGIKHCLRKVVFKFKDNDNQQ